MLNKLVYTVAHANEVATVIDGKGSMDLAADEFRNQAQRFPVPQKCDMCLALQVQIRPALTSSSDNRVFFLRIALRLI